MPSVTIPLVGAMNQRHQKQLNDSTNNVDLRFRNCDFDVIANPITGESRFYLQKRWGLSSHITTGASAVANVGLLVSVTGTIISAFGASAGTIYANAINCGSVNGKALHISEASISGKQYYFITDSAGDGWCVVSDSYITTSYTGNRTSGSPIITNVSPDTTGMYPGQRIVGDAGIPAGTSILSVDSSTQITLTANATSGAGTSTALTKTPIFELDNPFTAVGKFVYLDGYLFGCDQNNKRIYQSGLNNITSWGASDYITVQSSGEDLAGIARVGGYIVALCSASMEFFVNQGNPSGSVLSSVKPMFKRIGCNGGPEGFNTVPVYSSSGDTVFFLGNVGGQGRGVWALNASGEPKKISTPEVDRQIARAATSVFFIISSWFAAGKNYICVSETTSPYRQYFGCLETGMWSEGPMEDAWVVISGGLVNYSGSATTDTTGVFCVIGTGTDGKVYRLRNDIYTDDGQAFSLIAQTSKVDLGTENLKTYSKVSLLGSDVQSSGTALLEYSDDDYATWVTAGTFDLTESQPKIHRLGAHRGGRAWRLTHSDNTPFRASSLKFEYTVGQH